MKPYRSAKVEFSDIDFLHIVERGQFWAEIYELTYHTDHVAS